MYLRTVRDKLPGLVILAVILFLYIFWCATFFPAMKQTASGRDKMLSDPTMKAFVGDLASTKTYGGFMILWAFAYMDIALGAYVAFLTASFLAGEIEEKSSELMLSLPVSRTHVLLSRFAALVPILAGLAITMLFAAALGANYIGESIDLVRFGVGMLFTGAFLLATGGGSLLLSALMSNGSSAALASIGILFAMYLVENIGTAVSSIDWARKLSLFHYASITGIITDPATTIDWANLGILLAAAAVFLGLAIYAYQRRDIHVT